MWSFQLIQSYEKNLEKIAFILKSYHQVKPVSKIIISVEKLAILYYLFWDVRRQVVYPF